MTLSQLFAFANGDPNGPWGKRGFTVADARRLCSEIEAQLAKKTPEAFDVVGQINRSEARGSVNHEFARRATRGCL